jgi:hypothetical protein
MGRTLGIQLELSQSERALWTAVSFCPPLILLLIVALSAGGFGLADKYAVFIAIIAVVPALGFLGLSSARIVRVLTTETALDRYLCLNLASVLAVSPLLASVPYGERPAPGPWYAIAATYLFALALVITGLGRSGGGSFDRYVRAAGWMLVVVTPVVFVEATVPPVEWFSGFNRTPALAGVFGAALLYLLWLLRIDIPDRTRRPPMLLLTSAVPVLAAVAMCNVQLDYDALHYTAYLAPAAAAQNGRIPLVDVFCQYGQAYLLYNLAFALLPATFHAAALTTALANVAYTLCFVAILRKVISNHAVFVLLATGLVIVVWLSLHFSINGTPSLGGLRYLPVALLGAALVWMRPGRSFSVVSIAALLLCWAWSLEAALFGTFVYASFGLASSVSDGQGLQQGRKRVAIFLGRIVLLFITFVALAALTYLGLFKQLPRYDLYFGMVMAYVGPAPFTQYSVLQQGFYAWAPILTALFAVPCLIVRVCITQKKLERLPEIAVTWALAVVASTYLLLLTDPIYIKTMLLPFSVFLLAAVSATIETGVQARKLTVTHISFAPAFLFLVGSLSGSAAFYFMRPPAFASSSTSVLAELVHHRRFVPPDFSARLRALCQPAGTLATGNVCHDQPNMPPVHYREFAELVAKWQESSPSILVFHPVDALLSATLRKPHRLPLTFAYVDGFSPALYQYILNRSQAVISRDLADGETLIVVKDVATLNELQWRLLKMIAEQWRFERVDSTDNFEVYRLRKSGAAGERFVLPDRPLRGRNSL